MNESTMSTNFELHEYVIFGQSTKYGTHENKAIHSIYITQLAEVHKNKLFSNKTIFNYKNRQSLNYV